MITKDQKMTKPTHEMTDSCYVDSSVEGLVENIGRISENSQKPNNPSAVLCLMSDSREDSECPDKIHCIYTGSAGDISNMLYTFIMNADIRAANVVSCTIEKAMKDRSSLDNVDSSTMH